MDLPLPPDTAACPDAWLIVDNGAIVANWRRFAAAGESAACGAAVKANAYGLGALPVAEALVAAGCRDLFVAQWQEAAVLAPLAGAARIAVLHGAGAADMAVALASPAVPVLVTPAQVAAWRETGRPCDVMVDTGLNRLGLTPADAVSGLLDSVAIDTLHSHLACAEVAGHWLNARQRDDFAALVARVPARRAALANSAGIGLGPGYAFGLTRPGIGLYGGGPAPDGRPLAPAVRLAARIVQLRDVPAGVGVGYGATFTTQRPTRLAVTAFGYADGYPRSLSNRGVAIAGGVACPLVGRVAMDLTTFDVTEAPPLREGDALEIGFDLATTAAAAGRSEYELLAGMGARYARVHR